MTTLLSFEIMVVAILDCNVAAIGKQVVTGHQEESPVLRLRGAEQVSTELAERCSLSIQAVDLGSYCRYQRRGRCIPAKRAKLMLEMLLCLR